MNPDPLIQLILLLEAEYERPKSKKREIGECRFVFTQMRRHIGANQWKEVVPLLDKVDIGKLELCFGKRYSMSAEATKLYIAALMSIGHWIFSVK